MKKIFNLSLFVLLILVNSSCENEKDPVATPQSFLLTTTNAITPIVLQPQNATNEVATFKWVKSEVNIASAEPNYLLEIAKAGTNFAKPILANNKEFITTTKEYVLKVEELNNLLNSEATIFSCGVASDIEIRIKSVLGNKNGNAFVQYSNTINLNATPYSGNTPQLSFVTSQAEVAASNKMISTGILSDNFEGYFYLQSGNYKFYRPDSCGSFSSATVLGGTGTLAAGVIDATGASNIVIPTTGYYQIKANLTTNTFSIKEFTSVGVFGRATRAGLFGFNNIVPMNYDATNKKWTLTMDLLRGQALKFRTVKWTGALIIAPTAAPFPKPDYIPSGSTTVSTFGTPAANVLADDSNTDIKTGGTASLVDTDKYLVEVDISNPRKYTYKLTKI